MGQRFRGAGAKPRQEGLLRGVEHPALLPRLKERYPAAGDVKRGVDPHLVLGDMTGQLLVELLGAIGNGEPSVHDDVEAGIHHHAHGGVGAAVGGDQSVATVALVLDGPQLLHGEGGAERVGAQGAAASGHHLEEVGALLDELAGRMTDAVHAVGFRAHEPAVASRGGDGPAGCQQARAWDEALPDALFQREGGVVPAPAVADGGDAGLERHGHIVGRA